MSLYMEFKTNYINYQPSAKFGKISVGHVSGKDVVLKVVTDVDGEKSRTLNFYLSPEDARKLILDLQWGIDAGSVKS